MREALGRERSYRAKRAAESCVLKARSAQLGRVCGPMWTRGCTPFFYYEMASQTPTLVSVRARFARALRAYHPLCHQHSLGE